MEDIQELVPKPSDHPGREARKRLINLPRCRLAAMISGVYADDFRLGRIVYITRMWFSENERIGFMTCTPAGYRLVGVAGWVGILGWLQFLVLVAIFILFGVTRLFEPPSLWLFALPIAFRFVAQLLDGLGRSLAKRKNFEYHYKPDLASWLDGDARKTYPPNRTIEPVAAGLPSAP